MPQQQEPLRRQEQPPQQQVQHLVAVAQFLGHDAHHPVAVLVVERALERAVVLLDRAELGRSLGPDGAEQMLRLLGREPALKGIIEVAAMPAAIAALLTLMLTVSWAARTRTISASAGSTSS